MCLCFSWVSSHFLSSLFFPAFGSSLSNSLCSELRSYPSAAFIPLFFIWDFSVPFSFCLSLLQVNYPGIFNFHLCKHISVIANGLHSIKSISVINSFLLFEPLCASKEPFIVSSPSVPFAEYYISLLICFSCTYPFKIIDLSFLFNLLNVPHQNLPSHYLHSSLDLRSKVWGGERAGKMTEREDLFGCRQLCYCVKT